MSPEQAEGRLDQVSPKSDVYSLGATLYCLLTGKPPVWETDVAEALRQVQRGEFPPPRAVRPGIPPGLEAICIKAMATAPEGRYASARALADEIEHWLADEPVSVYREPITVRLTRWGRRHRTLATSLGVLLITAVVGLAITAALIRREQLQTEWERLRAELSLVETRRQRTIAEDKTRDATERAENLRRQDYVNRIALALREVQDDNVPLAEDLLQGCPVDLRGWEWDYVNRLAHLERLTYWSHRRYLSAPRFGQSIQYLVFSPDGTWIASGAGHAFDRAKATDMSEIRLWDPVTGHTRRTLGGLPGTVQTLAVSPDGTRLAAGGGYYSPKVDEGWLTVWDAATGKRLWTTDPESEATVMSVTFSHDGRSLLAGYGRYGSLDTGHARLWDAASGTARGEKFAAVKGGVNSVSFHRDGRRVALAGFGRVEIWDVVTGKMQLDLAGHTKWVFCAAFSPDGTRLATGGFDQTVKLWDATTGAEVRTLYGPKSFVRGVAFSPDGKLLTSVSEGKDVRLWEVATGRELATFHGHNMFVQAVAFHPDGRRVASGGTDGMVKIWDVRRSCPVVFRGHTGWVTHVAFRRDGRRIASETGGAIEYRTGDETIKVWDPATGEEDPSRVGAGWADLGSDFGPGGKYGDGSQGGGGPVTSPDGRRIVIVAPDQPVAHVKDVATDRVLTTLRGHTGWIPCLAFSPDGKRIATASQDQTIKIWDAEDGREVLTLRGHAHVVNCVAFSPDGHRLASGSIDTTARVWDATPFSSDDLREQEARRMVPPIHQYQFKDELIEQLRVDSTHSEPVRAAALAIIEPLADDPEPLDVLSWGVVRAADGRRDDYLRALHRAEAAVRLAPENGTYAKTLGVALYRIGRYEQALEALRRATALNTANGSRSTPAEVAFVAMAHHRLGHAVEARAGLDALRIRMRDPEAAKDQDSQIFHEAEALIDPKPIGTTTEARPAHQDESH
jgi:WD40 repeat protein